MEGGGRGLGDTGKRRARDVRRQAYRRKFRMDLLWLAKGAEGLVGCAGGRVLFLLDGMVPWAVCVLLFVCLLCPAEKPS